MLLQKKSKFFLNFRTNNFSKLTKQGQVIKEINSGNVKMIMFMLTSLVVIASGIILYEVYLSKQKKETTVQPFHYEGYRLFDGEDMFDEEVNYRPAHIRDI